MSHHIEPRIYVACLAAYNAGYLHGEWINANQDAEDIQAEISEVLKTSPIPHAEEWAIHDYEGLGRGVIEEYTGIETVAKLAAFIAKHADLGVLLLEHTSGDLEDAERLIENYLGVYASLADYAQELTEETTEIPANLSFYIDYQSMARDMEMNGDLLTIEEGFEKVHIFLSY
ncbi:MAG: antirestriction protein ArdA [Verrucomicrobiota bacterium JB022]|nr:antirestriction protein ArdA [Verrucomicrobiota bacterium JB022]